MMHPALHTTDHRPWPLPEKAWTWRQSWLNLAFLHYPVSGRELSRLLPSGVTLQEFDGSAWVGLVPFRMADVMRRPLPSFPPFRSFPELNLRTYVEVGGKPGVWFFSLDADCRPMVWGGKHIYGLPYFGADMEHRVDKEGFNFSSTRRSDEARFRARFHPRGNSFTAEPASFVHWVAERYCLYALSKRKGLCRVEVHHAPWPLHEAEITIEENTMLAAAGITPTDHTPICHFSTGVQVVSYPVDTIR